MAPSRKIEKYLTRRVKYARFVSDQPSKSLRLVITIPVCNEPEVLPTLRSIYLDAPEHTGFEVLVIVNHSESAIEKVKLQNSITSTEIGAWKEEKKIKNLHVIELYDVPEKISGVGHARKAVLDEGLIRLITSGCDHGILSCTDGDTLVGRGYVESLLALSDDARAKGMGFSFAFEHRLSDIPEWQLEAITRYELHLRYFSRCHDVMGHPHGTFTVGSAMACEMSGYIEQGGMNERKAGEDFYFLQKFAKAGRLRYHPGICVFPSARSSERVPFGTGKAVEDYRRTGVLNTYAFQAVLEVKSWISQVLKWYDQELQLGELEATFMPYLDSIDWQTNLMACRNHSTDHKSFIRRFFTWFDAFKVMKALHWLRDHRDMANQDVLSAVNDMRIWSDKRRFESLEDALVEMRKKDRIVKPA